MITYLLLNFLKYRTKINKVCYWYNLNELVSIKLNQWQSKGVEGGDGVAVPGRHLYSGSSFAHKCISTTPAGAPIYICTPVAIPPAPPLN